MIKQRRGYTTRHYGTLDVCRGDYFMSGDIVTINIPIRNFKKRTGEVVWFWRYDTDRWAREVVVRFHDGARMISRGFHPRCLSLVVPIINKEELC